MYIVNPFYTIFKNNSWLYDREKNKLIYSDNDITVNDCYLNIPFKSNRQYNLKLIEYLKDFLNNLCINITNSKNNNEQIFYNISFNGNENTPVNVRFILNGNYIKLSICHEIF